MSRTAEILLDRKREIEAEIAELQKELSEAEIALAAISSKADSLPSESSTRIVPDRRTRKGSMADNIFKTLAGYPSGLRSSIIRKRINKEYGRDLNVRIISWHLSSLKREGHLILSGSRWKLASPSRGALT